MWRQVVTERADPAHVPNGERVAGLAEPDRLRARDLRVAIEAAGASDGDLRGDAIAHALWRVEG